MELGKPDLSIVLPAIRVNNWKRLLDSIDLRHYSYEVIFVSPFDPPHELKNFRNVKFIKSYDTPSVATQKGLLAASGDLTWFTVDDCVMIPHTLDRALNFYYDNCDEKDTVNMRYKEGVNFSGAELPMAFWTAYYHDELRLGGIQSYWKISLQPLMKRSYLLDLGGLDCQFHYSNHSIIDINFRVQRDGGRIYDSPDTVTNASHMPGESGDHKPIHDTQTQHDKPIFDQMYSRENYRIKIPLDDYKRFEGVWKTRFKHQYETYVEMAKAEGYNI